MSLEDNRDYQNALSDTSEYFKPVKGLIKDIPSSSDLGRQNNTIICLLISLHQKLNGLIGRVDRLEADSRGVQIPNLQDLERASAALSKQLEGITLKGKEAETSAKENRILVWKDPYKQIDEFKRTHQR